MSIDHAIWNKLLSPVCINSFPLLNCAACGVQALSLAKKNIVYQRLKNQYDGRRFEHEDFDSSVLLKIVGVIAFVAEEIKWEQCRFSGHLICQSCGEVTSVMGKAKIPNTHAKTYSVGLQEQLMPEYFSPALPIIPLRPEYPLSLRQELGKSFAMFFSDASSAGNRVRTCVELLLDDQKIDRARRDDSGNVKISSSGREATLSLGNRIGEFGKKFPDFALMLGAIKSVGNEGSHGGDLDRPDLLRAYQIIDFILTNLYVNSKAHLEMLQMSSALKGKYPS